MPATGTGVSTAKGSLRSSWTPQYDALFDSRSGLSLVDSVGAESVAIKQFPVANYLNTAGAGYYTSFATGESPITTSGDYTVLIIARNENSDTIAGAAQLNEINGNNKGGFVYMRSGALYQAGAITSSKADLNANDSAKVVGPTEAWVLAYVFDSATNIIKCYLNGTEIDSVEDATWARGLASGLMSWTAYAAYTNTRIFGVWDCDRKLTPAELVNITDNGVWPSITPSRQYVHLNYKDTTSDEVIASHNRNVARSGNNGSNAVPADRATMWNSRYDNPVFAYPLYYGYTGWGNFKIPYLPTGVKAMSADLGDIEYPATSVIHNMAESMIDFAGISDAAIKAIFNKADRTYWKASIEDTDYYALGAYLWHPTQLIRSFITTHAESGHENHIFAGLRTSGQVVTGITKIGIFKTNLS